MVKRILKGILIVFVVLIVFVAGFIGVLTIAEYNPPASETLEVVNNLEDSAANHVKLDTVIKIMTFNTGYASLSQTEDFVMDGGNKGRMDNVESVETNITGISAILTNAAADITLLQEVDVNSDRSYNTLQFEEYSALLDQPVSLGYNYRCLFVPFPFQMGQMMGNVNSGIMTSANFFVEEAIRHQLPGSFAWPLRVANLKRCVTVSRLPIDGSDNYLVIINVHLSAYDDGTMRVQEMAALQELAESEYELGNYVVIGGDFNQTFPDAVETPETDTTPTDYLYELKDPGFWEAFEMDADWVEDGGWQFGVDPAVPTCRLLHQPYDTVNDANNQYYVIDGFIVSPNIIKLSVATLDKDFEFSDHNPVVMTFQLDSTNP